mgnify:CR=1 FL=1
MNEQIEEMSEILRYEDCIDVGITECRKFDDCNVCKATRLYNAGYRKQSESVWSTSVIFDVPAQKIVNYGHVCQSCFYSCKSKSPHGHKFCPNCGAHMKGGAE